MSVHEVEIGAIKPKKAARVWVSHEEMFDGEFLRGWHYAVNRVHVDSLGISLLPHEKNGVAGYNYLMDEKKYLLSSGSLFFNTPLASTWWMGALGTDLKAVKIARASKGKDGYALVSLYRLNELKNGVEFERDLETTQGAVIDHLRYGTPFPPTDAAE
jgi:hypothetical protein